MKSRGRARETGMKRNIARAALALLVLLLLASAVGVGAFALSGTDPLLYANLDRADFEFSYVPTANSNYALFLFSADGGAVSAEAQILEDGALIAEGEGSGEIMSAWLASGHEYIVRVHGAGNAVIEMARQSLSRNFANPLQAQEGQRSEKMIANAYDAHWYAFTAAQDGALMISGVPEAANLQLNALLFDAQGSLLSEAEDLAGGAFRLLHETRSGESYFIRICAPDGGEGYYALKLDRADLDEYLAFDAADLVLSEGSEADLSALLGGEASLWVSANPSVAAVDADGRVIALREGETSIFAYGAAAQAELPIAVEHVPIQKIEILGESLRLSAGDDADIQLELAPEGASDRDLRYRVEDPTIATVNRHGVLKALQPGETRLIVSSADGAAQDQIPVIVRPAARRWRALLVGEENYPFSEDTRREGSEESVAALQGLLGSVQFEDAAWAVRTGKDLSRTELLAQIRSAFNDATAQDVSLLYITSHGSYSGGMSFLELSDGSTLSMRDLERELRRISGTIVVLIDSCASGGAIGAYSDHIAFAKGVTGAFAGSSIRGSKYKVIASAGLDEDSFRIALNAHADTGTMATVFVRALCDGAGWDIDRSARGTLGADQDYNGAISLGELQSYMAGRVNWYLDLACEFTGEDYHQSIQVYPEGDPLVLFTKQPE